MNPFCWWQAVFGIGAAFGALGVACIIRYVLYTRMANHAQNIVVHTESLFSQYQADASRELDIGAGFLFETLARYIREQVERVDALARWLWLCDKNALWWFDSGKLLADEIDPGWKSQVRDIVKQGAATRKDFIDTVEPTLRPRVSEVSHAVELFRDSATRASIWAAVSFAMGGLVVGLFTLWPAG